MKKLTAAQKDTKRKLNNTINRLARQSGQSKTEVRRELALKLGLNEGNVAQMTRAMKPSQKRKLNEGLNYNAGDLVTPRERRAKIQDLNKDLRKAIKRSGREALELEAKWVKRYANNKGDDTFDELKTGLQDELSGMFDDLEHDATNFPKTLEDAKKSPLWGTFNMDFDRYVINNFFNGDAGAFFMAGVYDETESANRGYVFGII